MPTYETIADVLEQLGGIHPRRIRLSPPPGRATEKDLLRLLDRLDEARDYLKRLRALPEKAIHPGEGAMLLREAEELIEGHGAPAK